MERYNFRLKGSDNFINFDLNTTFDKVGIENDIDRYVQLKQQSLVNPIVDIEYSRFTYNGLENKILTPNFINAKKEYSSDISYALFTYDEINNQKELFTNSFFILEYYDKIEENQVLLYTSYLKPLISKGNTYDSIVDPKTNKITVFKPKLKYTTIFSTWNAFNFVQIPNNYLNGSETLYLKVSFFNAKIGGRTFFHINATKKENPINTDYYIPIKIDKNTLKYDFIDKSSQINLYEFKNINFINKERGDNTPKGSNTDNKTLILGSGEII